MQIGFGFYKYAITSANLRLATQSGADAFIVHMEDYLHQDQSTILRGLDPKGWRVTARVNRPLQEDELRSLKNLIESHDLHWYAFENVDSGNWYHILLDGSEK